MSNYFSHFFANGSTSSQVYGFLKLEDYMDFFEFGAPYNHSGENRSNLLDKGILVVA